LTRFRVGDEAVDLPAGAFAHSRRTDVTYCDRHLCSLSQGPFRAYLFPMYTPAGVAVTSESPVDHPHHNSVWIAADRVQAQLPLHGGDSEPGTYNFYVNDTFQGRAPGRIVSVDLQHDERGVSHLRLTQQLEWRGPREWGAPEGRVVATEARIIDLRVEEDANVIDLRSELRPTEWDLEIGPTRHAWFGVRMTETLRPSHGARLTDAAGNERPEAISGTVSDWVDCSGTAGGGRVAGVALMPHADTAGHAWYVTDWGTMTVNPFAATTRSLDRGEKLTSGVRLVVHDGDADSIDLPASHAAMADDVDR
jgi:hypothetical protein